MLVLTLALLATVLGVGAPAAPASQPPPMLTVSCTATVSYGDDLTCWAASTDSMGNFAEAGTFTFDKAHALAATWTASTCSVNDSQCEVDATLAAPPGAQPRTVKFVVGFKGVDGATVSTTVSVDVTLRPTVTTIVCTSVDLALGASTHCLVGVADQLYDWDSRPAQLGKGVGLTAVSSAPGDTIRYDKPMPGGAGCVAAVANAVLSCGFTLTTDRVQGVRSLTANYPGDPAADEQPSSAVLRVANGPRVAPTLTLTCPDTVPARTPIAHCEVTVAATGAGLLTPTGAVAVDQDYGEPVSWADAQTCQLVDGSCSVPIAVFRPTFDTPPPVRATYAGDDAYLPATADAQVDVLATPSTAKIACDTDNPLPNTLLHCQLTLSVEPGLPVPIGPQDAVFVSTSDGSVACDVPLESGCGGVDGDTSTGVGFSVQLGPSTGPELIVAEYTGDDINQVAPSSAGFSWVTPVPASVVAQPPPTPEPAPAPPATTSTAIACVGPVAYRHATQCTVAVTAAGSPVRSGSVQVAPAAGSAFPTVSCLLSDQGQCTVTVASQALPGVTVWLSPAFSGATALAPSTGSGSFVVHAVATSVTVNCAGGAGVRPGTAVSCVASVHTRYGTAAATPPARRSQVTVSVRGDAIVYGGALTAKSCHWTLSRAGLTCHFSVRAGHAAGVHLVRVHYTGTVGSTHNAASVGQTSFKVKR